MNCPECDAPVAENRKHCGECGAPLTNDLDPAAIGTGPPPDDSLLIDEPELPPEETAVVLLNDRMTVATGCDHVIGKSEAEGGKPNDQDYVDDLEVAYPLHGFMVIVQSGADGIGGGAGGERWAYTTVQLFLAAMAVRLPAFDQEEKFVNREQFWQLLNEKVKLYFFPTINWVTGIVFNFGLQEVGQKMTEGGQPTGKPAKQFGATWTASVMICDLKQGRADLHAYAVGDPSLFVITRDTGERLNTSDAWPDGDHKGDLNRWVGQGSQANGQVFQRKFQLDPAKLPYVHVLHCSDGLTNMLSPDVIAGVVREEAEPGRAVSQLLDQAVKVEIPYGQTLDPTQDPAITPGDDNVFAGITSIRFVSTTKGASDEPTDREPEVRPVLPADEDGDAGRDRPDSQDVRERDDAGGQ